MPRRNDCLVVNCSNCFSCFAGIFFGSEDSGEPTERTTNQTGLVYVVPYVLRPRRRGRRGGFQEVASLASECGGCTTLFCCAGRLIVGGYQVRSRPKGIASSKSKASQTAERSEDMRVFHHYSCGERAQRLEQRFRLLSAVLSSIRILMGYLLK